MLSNQLIVNFRLEIRELVRYAPPSCTWPIRSHDGVFSTRLKL
jgi:hypothetical protein